ncbi:MAG: iron complex transport system permease protein [Flavobacteriales bacterium]
MYGSVSIPFSEVLDFLVGNEILKSHAIILQEFRIPKAITAISAGAALSVSGLLMQTLFRNPLAGPFVLGISSGASLGVAILVMAGSLLGGVTAFLGDFAIAGMAIIGAGLVTTIVMLVARKINDSVSLLIIGLMFGSATGALVSILQYFSQPELIQAFVVWTFGSLGGLGADQIWIFAPILIVGIGISLFCQKPLDNLLLGESYAKALGVNVKQTRYLVVIATSILAGGITAFCGPISFIGLAIPHIARAILKTSQHKKLLPACLLLGSTLLLICDLIAQVPGQDNTLPINAITALFGAPVVIWVILGNRKFRNS